MLLNPEAKFDLAVRLRGSGISLADAFSFASGLYFRGKIAYARRFAGQEDLVRVITTNAGLLDPERTIIAGDLRQFAQVGIDSKNATSARCGAMPSGSKTNWGRREEPSCWAAWRRESTGIFCWRFLVLSWYSRPILSDGAI
jgi:hypothetical protein